MYLLLTLKIYKHMQTYMYILCKYKHTQIFFFFFHEKRNRIKLGSIASVHSEARTMVRDAMAPVLGGGACWAEALNPQHRHHHHHRHHHAHHLLLFSKCQRCARLCVECLCGLEPHDSLKRQFCRLCQLSV